MRTSTITLLFASALAVAPVSFAQQSADRSGQAQTPAPLAVSDAELETFATIYVDLLDTVEKFEGEMQLAKSEQEAREIQTRMQEESVAKVARHGWSPEKFNGVTAAINNDAGLAEKAQKLIEQKP
jgi:hypothetical protein